MNDDGNNSDGKQQQIQWIIRTLRKLNLEVFNTLVEFVDYAEVALKTGRKVRFAEEEDPDDHEGDDRGSSSQGGPGSKRKSSYNPTQQKR